MAYRDPERRKEYNRLWYEKNKEKVRARRYAYFAKNPEQARARSRAAQRRYYQRHRKEILAKVDKEAQRRRKNQWYQQNKPKIRTRQKELYERNRKVILGFKGQSGCLDCGEKDIKVLQFDHVPERGLKRYNIPASLRFETMGQALQNELEKCDVVCANCHARRTWTRRFNSEVME